MSLPSVSLLNTVAHCAQSNEEHPALTFIKDDYIKIAVPIFDSVFSRDGNNAS